MRVTHAEGCGGDRSRKEGGRVPRQGRQAVQHRVPGMCGVASLQPQPFRPIGGGQHHPVQHHDHDGGIGGGVWHRLALPLRQNDGTGNKAGLASPADRSALPALDRVIGNTVATGRRRRDDLVDADAKRVGQGKRWWQAGVGPARLTEPTVLFGQARQTSGCQPACDLLPAVGRGCAARGEGGQTCRNGARRFSYPAGWHRI